uniref:Methyltransferase like 25B n=1 Tax=Cynoglossus semilaevis TaxID=244447 RepID=A0A3P8UF77_CYNSE
MLPSTLTSDEQRNLATNICLFLSHYTHLLDSYIIEFFTEELWLKLPYSWQVALQDLSYPQIADLLLDSGHEDRRYPSVWPLSLLAYRATAHALAFCRNSRRRHRVGASSGSSSIPEEFHENLSQSSLLVHIFRKHVKAKKQHEIHKLGHLVKELCEETGCSRVVDVGSGQGHLTRFLSFGLGLSVTAVEADCTLVDMATRFDGQLLWALEKEKRRKVRQESAPRHVTAWVNPRGTWMDFMKQLNSTGTRRKSQCGPEHHMGCCHPAQTRCSPVVQEWTPQTNICAEGFNSRDHDFILTGLHACGDLSATLLRHFVNCPHVRGITSVACCYMKITTEENPVPPGVVEAPAPTLDSDPSVFGYPMSSWVRSLTGHRLSYKAREGACHALEDYVSRLKDQSELLRIHCYRAILETVIRDTRPELRRAGIQTIKKAHKLDFTEYARLGLARLGLPLDLDLDQNRVCGLLQQQRKVVVFFSLTLLLAPVVETLVLLDRMVYLQENGVNSQLVALFDPNFSPRNFVLVAVKPRPPGGHTLPSSQ